LSQGAVFCSDLKRHLRELSSYSKYEIANLTQSIATLALIPFALFADVYRLATKSINTATFFKNSYLIPKHMVISIFKIAFLALRVVIKTVNALSIEIGFLAWHGTEKTDSLIKGSTHTGLSNKKEIRDIIYNALGGPLLAAATFTATAVILPVAYVGAAIAGVTVIALCVAHIFFELFPFCTAEIHSQLERKKREKTLKYCAKLVGLEWTKELQKMKYLTRFYRLFLFG